MPGVIPYRKDTQKDNIIKVNRSLHNNIPIKVPKKSSFNGAQPIPPS